MQRPIRYSIFFALFVLLLVASGHSQRWRASASATPKGDYVDGELFVKYRGAASKSRLVVQQAGGEVIRDFASIGWQQVRLPTGMTVAEGIDRYRNLPDVELVQPNFIYHTLATPNDPQYSSLYGMTNIHAPQAWDVSTGSSAVVAAVIDLGVDYNHPDLSANMWRNPGETGLDAQGHDKATNGIDDDGNGYIDDVYGIDTINHDSDPLDDGGHGTHVAGIIGAVGNNNVGVVGVNWTVRIMAIKSHNSAGNGTSASVVEAFQYAKMMRQRGVNLRVTNSSWGGAPEAASYDQALKDAIDAAGDAGILNVCAAGNSSNNNDTTAFYPASYTSPSIVAVAASDQSDNRASFSSYGANSVDIAAPGVSILSTYHGSYAQLSGTSMASPHVTGAAALLAAFTPGITMGELKSVLLYNVDQLPQWSGLTVTGGRLNVAKALQSLATHSNQIDDAQFFVRQQYLDFLDRQPDQGGFDYWTNEISACGNDAVCVRHRRTGVSGAFFIEQEFQQTGNFLYRMYGAALGRRPVYSEFTVDHDQVVGGPNLEASKSAFGDQFVQRQEFLTKYPASMSGGDYVDGLLAAAGGFAGVDRTNLRSALLDQYNQCLPSSTVSHCRAVTLRTLADDAAFSQAVYNSSFVLMEYFGYLRREPDQQGYDFWIDVVNNGDPNNYNGMVCSFITSLEYQFRFSPFAPHSNVECGQ